MWRWYKMLLVRSVQSPIDIGIGGLGTKITRGGHLKDSINKIGQNTEKSPGDLKRLVVIQTPVESHQLTLVWKTLNEVK